MTRHACTHAHAHTHTHTNVFPPTLKYTVLLKNHNNWRTGSRLFLRKKDTTQQRSRRRFRSVASAWTGPRVSPVGSAASLRRGERRWGGGSRGRRPAGSCDRTSRPPRSDGGRAAGPGLAHCPGRPAAVCGTVISSNRELYSDDMIRNDG